MVTNLVVVAPFVFGEEESLFLFDMTSNSSKSVELWLVGDQGSWCFGGLAVTGGVATGVPHGSVLGAVLAGIQGSANGDGSWGGDESEDGFQGDACYKKYLKFKQHF